MKWSFGIVFLIFSNLVSAKTVCICEIGRYPQEQQSFFKAGCSVWLGGQKNCSESKVVEPDYNYTQELASADSSVKFKIGYVGHWGSSSQTVSFVRSALGSLIKNGNSIHYDNTACLSQNNADEVQRYVNNLDLKEGQEVAIKGNQAISIGKWDVVLASSANFWAITTSKDTKPIYPSCKDFRGASCMHWVQQGYTGLCSEKDGSTKQLRCCEMKSKVSEDPYSSKTPSYGWLEKKDCL